MRLDHPQLKALAVVLAGAAVTLIMCRDDGGCGVRVSREPTRAMVRRMAKKSKKASQPPPPPTPPTPPRWQWLTKPWTVAVAVGTVLGAVLLNINPILSNIRELPGEVEKTAGQFSGWFYEDAAWSGRWTNTPEGYVDLADMNLSKERIEINLTVKRGEISGTIATLKTCDALPLFDFLLVRGKVAPFGKSANVIVWDTVLGHKVDFAAIELRRAGSIISVIPKKDVMGWFPANARIAVAPEDNAESEPVCDPQKQAAFIEGLLAQSKEQKR